MTNQYPIGKFEPLANFSLQTTLSNLERIKRLATFLKQVSSNINDQNEKYLIRENGWTVRQMMHHIADSHQNSLIRLKLAMAEDNPKVIAYNQDDWVRLHDTIHTPILYSVNIIEATNLKMYYLFKDCDHQCFLRTFLHPEYTIPQTIYNTLAYYAWHGEHHVTQISSALN